MRRQQARGHRDRADYDPETLSGSSRQDKSPLPALSVEQSTSDGPTGHQDDPPFSRCKGSLQTQDLRRGDVAGKGRVPRLIDSLPVRAHDDRFSCTYLSAITSAVRVAHTYEPNHAVFDLCQPARVENGGMSCHISNLAKAGLMSRPCMRFSDNNNL